MAKQLFIILFALTLAGCASVQPKINQVSLQSYEQGCALRGIERGMSSKDAQAVCRCHVQKAIQQTSEKTFLEYSELLARANDEQKQTTAFKDALHLMRGTFKACQSELNIH